MGPHWAYTLIIVIMVLLVRVCVLLKQDMDNTELVKEIDDHIESLRDSIGWAHDNINECLTNIVHLEEAKVGY